MLQRSSELDIAQYPVNQQIESGEPVMSENYFTVRVQWGDIQCHWGDFTGGKADRQVGCFGDHGGGSAVK